MRRLVFFALALAGCRGAAASSTDDRAAPTLPSPSAPAEARGFAVLELFTSEGCNSCPPADAVLGGFAEASRAPDARVFPIAFHVDYWNSLGWDDRFSSAELTSRQKDYATSFAASGMYTPQLVVNGTAQFNGADRERARAAIDAALALDATATIALAVEARGAGVLVRWRVDGAPGGALVRVVVAERAIVSRVRAGENAGKTLHHENVARAFASRPVSDGEATLAIPSDVVRANAHVVAWVQRGAVATGGMPIVAAAKSPLP